MDYPGVKKMILGFIRSNLSRERYIHSVSVSETLAALCVKFGQREDFGLIAGLGHDIARELPDGDLFAAAAADGNPIREWERTSPVLLHGRAGSVILKRNFGISDKIILDAVSIHSTGSSGMDDFAKLLYIADYIEPLRTAYSPEFVSSISGQPLNIMLFNVLEQVLNYLKRADRPIAEPSILLYDKLVVELPITADRVKFTDRVKSFEKKS